MTEVAKRLGMDVEFINIPFQGLFAAVQSGQIDAAVSSITITKKRLESVSFAQPYYDSDQSLTVRPTAASRASPAWRARPSASTPARPATCGRRSTRPRPRSARSANMRALHPAMLDLEAGRIDGYISDIPALLYYVKDKPQFEVVERIKTTEQYSVMFAKDAPLATKVNDVITEMKKDGSLAKIHEKWFGTKPDEAWRPRPCSTCPSSDARAIAEAGGLAVQAASSALPSSGRAPCSIFETFLNYRVFVETLPLILSGLSTTLPLGFTCIVLGFVRGHRSGHAAALCGAAGRAC